MEFPALVVSLIALQANATAIRSGPALDNASARKSMPYLRWMQEAIAQAGHHCCGGRDGVFLAIRQCAAEGS
ncbi:unnamed protein product [Heligmosomoides polygyrus]|uniref:Secreted protein n=1 Tax=Heligmosomoides polygyrus TaxID=6339 RepID=A0A183GBH6_HELPZ|nr:unnamed protein product [Heligmosomoides polygyrus]